MAWEDAPDQHQLLLPIQRINSLQFSIGSPEASYGELESIQVFIAIESVFLGIDPHPLREA
jgi:hypothetical protein